MGIIWQSKGATKGGIMMRKLKGQMDKGEHDDVQMKGGYKMWHYDVQIQRVDG